MMARSTELSTITLVPLKVCMSHELEKDTIVSTSTLLKFTSQTQMNQVI